MISSTDKQTQAQSVLIIKRFQLQTSTDRLFLLMYRLVIWRLTNTYDLCCLQDLKLLKQFRSVWNPYLWVCCQPFY